jgi:small subunit ribosomal protein S16
MAVKIRLARGGAKKKPYYRVVIANATAPRDGDFIEKVGTYNPLLAKGEGDRVTLKTDRIVYWLSEGATPTDKVARFISDAGIALPGHVTKKIAIKNKGYELKAKNKAEEEAVKAKEAERAAQAEAEATAAAAKIAEAEAAAKAAEEAASAKAASEATAAEEAAPEVVVAEEVATEEAPAVAEDSAE